MDDLKVILYIVGAIIWVVYNNYRKIMNESKKRNPSQPAPQAEVIPPYKAPTTEKPQQVPRRQSNTVPKPSRQTMPAPTRKPLRESVRPSLASGRKPLVASRLSQQKKNEVSMNYNREGGAIQPSKIVQFEETLTVTEYANSVLSDLRDGDMQKAIIYSEILKRPYN
ncbi:MAG: hypothetical protein IPL22_03600 [Bacteroidetes bacterium]|nr:hypothetical protein [Bacteroidota bacterium]